jgi:hypothetical protein
MRRETTRNLRERVCNPFPQIELIFRLVILREFSRTTEESRCPRDPSLLSVAQGDKTRVAQGDGVFTALRCGAGMTIKKSLKIEN